MTWKTEPLRATLDKAARDGPTLCLEYTAINQGPATIYLFDRLFRADRTGRPIVDAGLVYATVFEGTLQLARQLVEVPPWVFPEAPEVPFLTALEPGRRLTRTLSLTLPIPERYPYMHPKLRAAAPRPAVADRLTLTVGYCRPDRPESVREVWLGDTRELCISYARAVRCHAAVTLGPVALRCDVLDRSATRD